MIYLGPKTASDYVYVLTDLLAELGLTRIDFIMPGIDNEYERVDKVPADKRVVLGRCFYKEGRVEVNFSQDARGVLRTLAHEGGHWLLNKKRVFRFCTKLDRSKREALADLYGWQLLRQIGADNVMSWSEFARKEY